LVEVCWTPFAQNWALRCGGAWPKKSKKPGKGKVPEKTTTQPAPECQVGWVSEPPAKLPKRPGETAKSMPKEFKNDGKQTDGARSG